MRPFSDYVTRKGKATIRKKGTGKYRICKRDNATHRVFGYAIATTESDLDTSGITVKDLEMAIYEYIRKMTKEQGTTPASVIESCVFTSEKQRAIGIPKDTLPDFAYWIGLEIHDQGIWEMLRESEFPVFSIEITGQPE